MYVYHVYTKIYFNLSFSVLSFTSPATTLKFNLVERNQTAVANSTLTVAARTAVECGMYCSHESLCAAFKFDVDSNQCVFYLGCVTVTTATGTVVTQYSTSQTYTKQILYRTDLALGMPLFP